ncbi:hypothetical protein DL766_009642 [Monosporascus sp. MC13-8B]|uniref:EDC4-like protein pdc1 beta-propeller domain-containing protein n=1 Tax=Monosporascus cannonballus TaxID=155416 RepID=A0ABY0H304_9PEZI|nr:hypothetical protein DL762_007361 [Monosporascus cannonballus]RYP14552.1 hypothetical protein DL766_009642 [Monosporascus sp. MC13-8B]
MASYGPPPGGNDSNSHHLQAMFARMQAARNNQEEDSSSNHDLLSRFSTYNHGNNQQNYYDQSAADSPILGSSDNFPLPAAPSPPGNFSHSHHPPGLGNPGPVGSMPSSNTAANNSDQSANLLNLLKFSGSGHQKSQLSPPTTAGQTQYTSFDGTISLPHSSIQPPLHAPVPMPADPQGLLATLMKGTMGGEGSAPEAFAPKQPWHSTAPSANTQAYLLNLLHRPKPSQNDLPSTNESSQPPTLTPPSLNNSATDHSRDYSQLKQALSANASQDNTPMQFKLEKNSQANSPSAKFEHTSPASSQHDSNRKPAKFDYANPFDEFAAPPRQTGTPRSTASGAPAPADPPNPPAAGNAQLPATSTFQILKKASSATSSPGAAQDNKRSDSHRSSIASPQVLRKLDETPTLETERGSKPSPSATVVPANGAGEESRETVADAMSDLADKADKEAQEAIDKAVHEEVQAKISHEIQNMMRAGTDAEFQEAAEVAAKDIKQELDRKENEGVLEDTYSPRTAQAIRDIVEDAAHGPVADSWESAEADEIVVIEEEEEPTPVKVYNFPMKPWISINMQDNEEPRPQFRDEVVLDIARLKKEFDQIDRNLVSATESYMAYGMSKAGGLRVIRQDDGKDAKLFTDTKDRIFNVAVSSTPSDLNATPKECIIGTGISGTVYYVQIKNGEKDHLDDPHPEQYGFALPPISSQEGDTPGGVLKTRARTSSAHPDYFAVGRGKTISIIWPAYIMQNNLFKPGHDRVVDTEKLSKQCALRINTGKAGKDFTFSPDDTTIVSLDKSGRVKFWDVQDLTAADEGSDPRFPMPAQTSLEVKEPLMTLNTTPEGEKAWPTSVLLLDKQRPYQKRCALRYMIVGMKQNHTLQLWDLALGKPVQEFNLPHTKESDAVCSVMYHPASGMIVVGHPTRNSIYFLHLSAPKYTIKGLSQVDYIQKLVAKDSSIPEPDSTAVISGVREYSFSNKGVLRSLDILPTPAASSDGEEPTLFELYAMHSKGVTAIWVKQKEVGWDRDNKVIAPVDATEAGLVKIAKLKELPNAFVSEAAEEPAALPIRIATRSSSKETPPPRAAYQDQSGKGAENNAAANLPSERKEAEAPITPVNQLDKAEKKTRKKREKAAAAAAAAAAEKLTVDNAQANGVSHSPRAGPVSGKNAETRNAPSVHSAMSPESVHSAVKQIETGLRASLSGIIASEMKDHRTKIEAEFRGREESFNHSQQNLLHLVSSVLNENVQGVLSKIVSDQFEDNVVPAVTNTVTKTITEQLDSKIGGRVSHSIQNQMQKLLPNAVTQALQKPELAKAISDKVVSSVAMDMEESFRQTLLNTITPIFSDMAVAASRSVVQDVQRRTAEQIELLEQRHVADSHKIDQLTALVTRLSDTVSAMAATQSQFQDGFLKMQQQLSNRVPVSQPQPSQSHSHSYGSPPGSSHNQLVPFANNSPATKDSQLQHLIADVASQMERGDYETGLIRWLQGDRKHEVFDKYIVKFNPNFLQELPVLVSLSVGAVISEELDGPLLRERVSWLEIILHGLHSTLPDIDHQIRDVVPNIMSQFIARLEALFLQVSSRAPSDPILKHLSNMNLMANRVRDVATHHARY